ncbi:CsbD family protein [Arthrobacter sp. TMN-50]
MRAGRVSELAGEAKETVGDATDNQDLRCEGQVDQGSAHTKQASENVKDFMVSKAPDGSTWTSRVKISTPPVQLAHRNTGTQLLALTCSA